MRGRPMRAGAGRKIWREGAPLSILPIAVGATESVHLVFTFPVRGPGPRAGHSGRASRRTPGRPRPGLLMEVPDVPAGARVSVGTPGLVYRSTAGGK